LLESNLSFEQEQKNRTEPKGKKKPYTKTPEQDKRNENQSDGDGFDSDSDEEESSCEGKGGEDEESLRCLVLLREIRSFGAKPVLRIVAQAMSKFWVSQRHCLGYSHPNDPDPMTENDNLWPLWQERSEVVRELSSQMVRVLKVLRSIVESPCDTTTTTKSAYRSLRRSYRHGTGVSGKLSDKEVGDLLWNAMDLEVRERLKASTRRRRKCDALEEPEPREDFLVDWVFSLKESMGGQFAMDLAKTVGVNREYEALWNV